MNFYKRFMADYAKKTSRLTLAQHGAYTLLLDEVYSTEAPLPADVNELYRVCRAMTKDEQSAVRVVADLYFPVGNDGLRSNQRVTLEISKAKQEAESVRAFWTSLPKEVRSEMRARSRAAKLNATPSWLSTQDNEQIAAIYKLARTLSDQTGIPHEVDHIVPLQGKSVCGMHVPWNLAAIPASVNRRKGRSLQ